MGKYVNFAIVAIALVILIIVLYPILTAPKSASLIVSDQSLIGNQVSIDAFFLDKPGYVIIHKNVDEKPGQVIGNSDLVSGSYKDFKVKIDETQAGTKVFAMLHYDDGDSIYEFPGDDAPVNLEDTVVVKPINFR